MDPQSEVDAREPIPGKAPDNPRPSDQPKDDAAIAEPQSRAQFQILSLPTEIIMMILQELQRMRNKEQEAEDRAVPPTPSLSLRAIQNVRLACRTLGALGIHVLLSPSRPLTVESQPRSLARLESISRHPVLRRVAAEAGVRVSLRYYHPRLAGDATFFAHYCYLKLEQTSMHWRRRRLDVNGRDPIMKPSERDDLCRKLNAMAKPFAPEPTDGGEKENLPEAQIYAYRALPSRAHAEYAARFEAQEALRGRGRFSLRVAAALGRMSEGGALKQLEFCDDAAPEVKRMDIRVLRRLVKSADLALDVLAAPACWCDSIDAELSVASPADPVMALLCALPVVPAALIISVPLATGTGWAPNRRERAHVRAAAKGLRVFRYAPRVNPMFFVPTAFDPQVEFLEALIGGAALGLEQLSFDAPKDRGFLDFGAVVADPTGGSGWPKLHTLSLRNVALRLEDLERFIERCRPGLRSFNMCDLKLLSGNMDQVRKVVKWIDCVTIVTTISITRNQRPL